MTNHAIEMQKAVDLVEKAFKTTKGLKLCETQSISTAWLQCGLPADVRLVFDAPAGDAEPCDPLPVHSQVLSLASPVLRKALTVAASGPDGVKNLPLPGDDPDEWKLVLGVLYDGLVDTGRRHDEPLITWKNAQALAELSDKYDMARLRGAVDRFLSGPSNVQKWNSTSLHSRVDWLGVASRCGLPMTTKLLLNKVYELARQNACDHPCGSSQTDESHKRVRAGLDRMTQDDTRALLLKFLGFKKK